MPKFSKENDVSNHSKKHQSHNFQKLIHTCNHSVSQLVQNSS